MEEPIPTADPTRTPTKVLLDCLEDFGRSEPLEVVVCWINEAGDLMVTGNVKRVHAVGLLRCAERHVLDARLTLSMMDKR